MINGGKVRCKHRGVGVGLLDAAPGVCRTAGRPRNAVGGGGGAHLSKPDPSPCQWCEDIQGEEEEVLGFI